MNYCIMISGENTMRSVIYQFSEEEIMNQRRILRVVLATCVVLSMSSFAFGAVYANDVNKGFPEKERDLIEDSIISGSSQFFQGMTDLMKLFDEAEYNSKNRHFPNGVLFLEAALVKFKMAKEKYSSAAETGRLVEQKDCSFDYLKVFDFDKFTAEKGMNSTIVQDLKGYLCAGNVTGYYQRIADDIEKLISLLDALKTKLTLSNNTAFDKGDYWKILQFTSEMMLFGNYGTVIGENAYKLYMINNE